MAEEVVIKLVGYPHRVNFLTNHPVSKQFLFPGDVVVLPLEYITDAMRRDGLFQRLPDGTPENLTVREQEHIVGITISEEQYTAQQALAALNSKVAPGFSEAAKTRAANPVKA